MIEVHEMSGAEIEEMLGRIGYGHLACARNNQPYVVPIHYVYEKPDIFVYTTEGLKTEIIDENPQICLQLEELVDDTDWQSVVINGEAERLVDREKKEDVLKKVLSRNPTLTPAISIRWVNDWIRENKEVIFRIKPTTMTGRSAVKVRISAAVVQPGVVRRSQIL